MSRYLALIIALISGALAVVLIYGYVGRMKKDVYAGMELVPVLVAATDIAEGSHLTGDNVAYREYPGKYISQRSIGVKEGTMALGAVTKFNIEKGKPILWSDLEESSITEQGFAELLQSGMTTFVLPVTDVTGVAGRLKPNQRVDVLYTFDMSWLRGPSKPDVVNMEPQDVESLKKYVMKSMAREAAGQGEDPATAVLLQNALILATGSTVMQDAGSLNNGDSSADTYSSVTLMVTPHQSRVLTFSMGHGTLSLALRKTGDSMEDKNPEIITKSVMLKQLLGSDADEEKITIMQ